jgi:FAD/FMN-containing dehydrogenase
MFGIALEITVRLVPLPASIVTLLADFSAVRSASQAVSAIIASGIVPAALEMMDRSCVAAVEASIYAAGYPVDAAAVLLVELDGSELFVELESAAVMELLHLHGARSVQRAASPVERARLWQGRKKAFGAMGRLAPDLAVQDAVVPRSTLPDILDRIGEIRDRHGLVISNVFHAGDGNLHPNISYDRRNPELAARVRAANREIMEACIAVGGSITGEHGVGSDKIEYMDQMFDAPTLAAMCDLRRVFDPEGRSNPGKVVPHRSCREWRSARPSSRGNGK